MQVLKGHNSSETAYIIADYPYGFRLRCQMRCWIETTKYGQRFVTQTSNPKRAGLVWNKPKASTYSDLRVMFLDDQDHIQNDGFSIAYRDENDLAGFLATYGEALQDAHSQEIIRQARAIFATRKHITVTIAEPSEAPQTEQEQAEVMQTARAIFNQEYAKLG